MQICWAKAEEKSAASVRATKDFIVVFISRSDYNGWLSLYKYLNFEQDITMSETLKEQQEVVKALKKMHGITPTELLKKEHISYMSKNLVDMGKAIIYFDYGHPWVYYYILNSLYLLGKEVPEELQ